MTDPKAALRAALRVRRRDGAARLPNASTRLVDGFEASGLALPAAAAVYLRQGSEIDPDPLARWLRARNVRVLLPVVTARDAPLAFREAMGGCDGADALGLPVPGPDAPDVRPDVVFTPLLGFDRRGGRIGQGGGYYDRTLQALRTGGPPVLAIGLAYTVQEVESVPVGPFDQPLDGVLTETAYLSFP